MTERDVIVNLYEAFNRGDIPAVLATIDPQAELVFEGTPAIPWAGTWRGLEGWTNFFGAVGGALDELSVSMEIFAVDGERVVAAGRYRGRVKSNDQRIDSPLVHLWTVRNGRIVRCVETTNTAVEAAACTAAGHFTRSVTS